MTVKSMITDFKNLFSSLIKKIVELVQEFYFVDSKNLFLLFKSAKNKISNLKATNVRLMFFHLHRKNMGDVLFRLFLLKLFYKNDGAVNMGFMQYFFYKNKLDKVKFYLSCVKNSADYLNATSNDSRLLNIKIDWYDRVYSENNIEIGCIDLVFDHFTVLSSDYVDNFIIKQGYTGHSHVLKCFIDHFKSEGLKVNVLDIGCGTGINCHFLKMNGITNIVDGVDISDSMSSIASDCRVDENAVYDNVLVGDYRKIILNDDILSLDKYGAIVAIDSLNYEGSGIKKTISMIRERLADGGLFILAVPHLEHESLNDDDKEKKKDLVLHDCLSSSFAYSEKYIVDSLIKNCFHIINKKLIELYSGRNFCFFECTTSV